MHRFSRDWIAYRLSLDSLSFIGKCFETVRIDPKENKSNLWLILRPPNQKFPLKANRHWAAAIPHVAYRENDLMRSFRPGDTKRGASAEFRSWCVFQLVSQFDGSDELHSAYSVSVFHLDFPISPAAN